MEGLDWWPQLPEFQTFLDEQTLLPLTSAEGEGGGGEEHGDEVDDTDDEYGVDDAVDDGHGVGDDDESRIVKAGNMRRGDVGDTGVFPREYQSRTSAPRPPKMLQAPRKWDICQHSQRAGKAIFFWNVTGEGSFWRSDFKEWNSTSAVSGNVYGQTLPLPRRS